MLNLRPQNVHGIKNYKNKSINGSFSHNKVTSISDRNLNQHYLYKLYGFHLLHYSLPNDIILDRTKLKAFADDKLNVAVLMIFLFDRVENTVGKGENAGFQHFLLFPQCFRKLCFIGSLKVGIVW